MQNTKDHNSCRENCGNNQLCRKWTFKVDSNSGKCKLKKTNGTIPMQPCIGGCITGFRKSQQEFCGKEG